jgi:hypothetical protein
MQTHAGQHLVGNHHRAVAAAHAPERRQVTGLGHQTASVGKHGLHQHGGDVVTLGEERLQIGQIVPAHEGRTLSDRAIALQIGLS